MPTALSSRSTGGNACQRQGTRVLVPIMRATHVNEGCRFCFRTRVRFPALPPLSVHGACKAWWRDDAGRPLTGRKDGHYVPIAQGEAPRYKGVQVAGSIPVSGPVRRHQGVDRSSRARGGDTSGGRVVFGRLLSGEIPDHPLMPSSSRGDEDMLPTCTLCQYGADPRHGLMTKTGDYYPLCDGCAPYDRADDQRAVADMCRASGKAPSTPLGRFGHNEPQD